MTAKGMTRSSTTLAGLVELFAGLLGLVVLFLIIGSMTSSDLRLVLYFVAGALTMTLLSLLNAVARPSRAQSRQVHLIFNAVAVTQHIDEGWRKLDKQPSLRPASSSLDMSPRTLLGQDNSLALAYLRMEIERAMRSILNARGLNWAGSSMASAETILEGLVRLGVVDKIWASPLEEVMRACNQAVHGTAVPDETTLAVISSGEQILEYLRSVAEATASPTP